MNPLRNARHLARFVLVWFALSIGVAIASPMVQPQGMQLVCSGSGSLNVVIVGDDDQTITSSHSLDCPLCASFGAPPVADPAGFGLVLPRLAPHFAGFDHLVEDQQTAPPPARAPPVSPLNA